VPSTKSYTEGGGSLLKKNIFYVNAPDIAYAHPIDLDFSDNELSNFVITTKIAIGQKKKIVINKAFINLEFKEKNKKKIQLKSITPSDQIKKDGMVKIMKLDDTSYSGKISGEFGANWVFANLSAMGHLKKGKEIIKFEEYEYTQKNMNVRSNGIATNAIWEFNYEYENMPQGEYVLNIFFQIEDFKSKDETSYHIEPSIEINGKKIKDIPNIPIKFCS